MSTFTHRGLEWELFAPGLVAKTDHRSFLRVEDGQIRYRHIDGGWISADDARDIYGPVLEHFGLMPTKPVPLPFPEQVFSDGTRDYRWVAGSNSGEVSRHYVGSKEVNPVTWRRHEVVGHPRLQGLKEALDFYWPTPTSFTDKDGDVWVRGEEPGEVWWEAVNDRWRATNEGLQFFCDDQWSTTEANSRSMSFKCAKTAIEALWPDFKPTAQEQPTPDDEPITWSFEAAQDDVDIARVLREAREKGALEVTIRQGVGPNETYLHLSVSRLVEQYLRAVGGPSMFTTVGIQDWVSYYRPLLADARAWEAAQKKPKVRVTVTGVK